MISRNVFSLHNVYCNAGYGFHDFQLSFDCIAFFFKVSLEGPLSDCERPLIEFIRKARLSARVGFI